MKVTASLYCSNMDPKIINVTDTGRICYETQKGPNHHVTVECALNQKAYRLKDLLNPGLQIGDWISFSGIAKVNKINRGSQPEKLERVTYCHFPYDGSNKEEWEYLQLEDDGIQVMRVPPLDVKLSVIESHKHLYIHLTDWDSSCNPNQLRNTIAALEETLVHLRFWLQRKYEEEESRNSLKLF